MCRKFSKNVVYLSSFHLFKWGIVEKHEVRKSLKIFAANQIWGWLDLSIVNQYPSIGYCIRYCAWSNHIYRTVQAGFRKGRGTRDQITNIRWIIEKAREFQKNISVQLSSVAQSCPTLCDPMNRSMPGLPVHHQLPEITQTHVHWVSDAIQPSYPLPSPSPPALNPSQHKKLFKWVSSLHQVAKVLEFQLQHQSFQWTARTDLL